MRSQPARESGVIRGTLVGGAICAIFLLWLTAAPAQAGLPVKTGVTASASAVTVDAPESSYELIFSAGESGADFELIAYPVGWRITGVDGGPWKLGGAKIEGGTLEQVDPRDSSMFNWGHDAAVSLSPSYMPCRIGSPEAVGYRVMIEPYGTATVTLPFRLNGRPIAKVTRGPDVYLRDPLLPSSSGPVEVPAVRYQGRLAPWVRIKVGRPGGELRRNLRIAKPTWIVIGGRVLRTPGTRTLRVGVSRNWFKPPTRWRWKVRVKPNGRFRAERRAKFKRGNYSVWGSAAGNRARGCGVQLAVGFGLLP